MGCSNSKDNDFENELLEGITISKKERKIDYLNNLSKDKYSNSITMILSIEKDENDKDDFL